VSFLIKQFIWIFSLLPLPVVHFIGTVIGWFFYLIPNKRRSTTITNLDLCFPEMSAAQRKKLVRRSLIEAGKGVAETGGVWLWSHDRALRLIRKVSGRELLDKIMTSGKGCIIASPHIGTWEIAGLYCSLLYPMTSLYRPPPLAGMNNLMRYARERAGAKLVPTDRNGVKLLLAALKNGETIGILPDQDPSSGVGVFAPFFGIQAKTMTLLSKLANKTGSGVLICYAERLPYGRGYHIHFSETSGDVADSDAIKSCTAINMQVEKCVRELPEQYLWCYKRFRSRPAGENKIYTR